MNPCSPLPVVRLSSCQGAVTLDGCRMNERGGAAQSGEFRAACLVLYRCGARESSLWTSACSAWCFTLGAHDDGFRAYEGVSKISISS